jgi:uncharacterized protein YndB with AHSA1/START domain
VVHLFPRFDLEDKPYAESMVSARRVSATRLIHAPASTIFDLLADPRQHQRLDGSESISAVVDAPERLFLGATFSMGMHMGVRYRTKNKVVAFEENKCIAWHHFAQFVWRYDLEEVDGATRVTESFDYDKPWAFTIIAMGFPEKNRRAMEATLARLEQIVTA